MADAPGPQPEPPRAGSPLWMRLLLVASLGVNLAILGMVIGALASGGGPGAPRQTAGELGGTPFVRALAPEDRRALLRDLRQERRWLRENREVLRSRFEALLETLRAEELDEARLARIIAESRAAGEARQDLGERLVLARVAAMDAAERWAYANRLEAEIRPQRRR